MLAKRRRTSATRPEKENAGFVVPAIPGASDADFVLPPELENVTPTKKGTLTRIKEAVFSPFKNLSPTKNGDEFFNRKVLFSPGTKIDDVKKRGSARRLRSRNFGAPSPAKKPISITSESPAPVTPLGAPELAIPSGIPKLDIAAALSSAVAAKILNSPRKEELAALNSGRKDVVHSPRRQSVSPRDRSDSITGRQSSSESLNVPLTPEVVAKAPLPAPLSAAKPTPGRPLPPIAAAVAKPSELANVKKRDAPDALASPAKRRKTLTQSQKGGLITTSPIKNHTYSDSISANKAVTAPGTRIVVHTRNYSCDSELLRRERRHMDKHGESMSIEGAVPVFERPVQTSEEALRAFRQVPSPRPQPPTIFESGTPKELVEWLVFGNESDDLTDVILMAYAHFKFMAPQLFMMLMELYQTPPSAPGPAGFKERIVRFVSRWVESPYSTDFSGTNPSSEFIPEEVYKRFLDLIHADGHHLTSDDDGLRSMEIKKSVRGRRLSINPTGRTSIMGGRKGSLGGRPKTEFMHFNHDELAAQLTVLEFNLFRGIQQQEYRNQAWNKAEKESKAPAITAIINHFNKIAFWVATDIVTAEPKEQSRRIKKFIKFAAILKDMANFSGVMEVISGLESLPVQRLKSAWKNVPSKHIATLKKLEDMMQPSQNFGKYRNEVKKATRSPVVPYLGVYLGDIVHIVEGIPDLEDGKIELAKVQRLGEVLIELRKLQLQPCALTEDSQYSLFFHNMKPLSPEVLEKMSNDQRDAERAN